MPHLIGMFRHRNPNIFLARVDVIEETKITRSSHFGKKRKVHAVAEPRRTEWIRITKPGLYRSHKRAASYRIWSARWQFQICCRTDLCAFHLSMYVRTRRISKGVNDLPARPFL